MSEWYLVYAEDAFENEEIFLGRANFCIARFLELRGLKADALVVPEGVTSPLGIGVPVLHAGPPFPQYAIGALHEENTDDREVHT